MHRILVIGSGGAGKSTLARRVGATLGLPVIHLDALYWQPGWVPTPENEWEQRVAALVAGARWVMDGNYGGTLDQRLAVCDTVVFLDLPRWLCLARVVWRRLRYAGRTRPDVAPGCAEQVSWEFVSWIWKYPHRRRPGILRRLAVLPADRQVVVLRSRREVMRWLATLSDRALTAPAP